jgi:hypothetical protein
MSGWGWQLIDTLAQPNVVAADASRNRSQHYPASEFDFSPDPGRLRGSSSKHQPAEEEEAHAAQCHRGYRVRDSPEQFMPSAQALGTCGCRVNICRRESVCIHLKAPRRRGRQSLSRSIVTVTPGLRLCRAQQRALVYEKGRQNAGGPSHKGEANTEHRHHL